jgi:hypothetical protein
MDPLGNPACSALLKLWNKRGSASRGLRRVSNFAQIPQRGYAIYAATGVLHHPPRGWKAAVRDHFKRAAFSIPKNEKTPVRGWRD